MHECERSRYAFWTKNCEVFKGGNIWEINIDEQFSETRVESKHPRQQASLPKAVGLFFMATQVYFVMNLAWASEKQVGLAFI